MKIGLVDVDGHGQKGKKKWGATIYPNLALCKIARWHRKQGDEVEWAFPLKHYDRVYMSKVFNFSQDDLTAYDADEIAIEGRTHLVLMDNNILAAGDYAKEQLQKIIDRGYRVDFNQALDARLVTEDFARLLGQVKWINRIIRFGCDTPRQIQECKRAMEMINAHGFTGEYFLYTMLTNDFIESFFRIEHWWKQLRHYRITHDGFRAYPYAQPYRDPDNPRYCPPQWQKDMAQWVNKRQIFTQTSFADFEPRKGFKCKKYIDELT